MLNKKTVGVVVLSLSTLVAANSYAATQGAYVGGQLGYGNVHQSSGHATHGNSNGFSWRQKDDGLAGRLFAGYQVNPNLAGELGWTKFSNATFKASGKSTFVSDNVKATIKTDAIDLVAKGIYPVATNVNVYGKAGVAYVMARGEAKSSTTVNKKTYVGHYSESDHKILPTFGVGASYDFTQNVAADVSYNRIQKVGNSSNINSTDLVSVGLIYSIG